MELYVPKMRHHHDVQVDGARGQQQRMASLDGDDVGLEVPSGKLQLSVDVARAKHAIRESEAVRRESLGRQLALEARADAHLAVRAESRQHGHGKAPPLQVQRRGMPCVPPSDPPNAEGNKRAVWPAKLTSTPPGGSRRNCALIGAKVAAWVGANSARKHLASESLQMVPYKAEPGSRSSHVVNLNVIDETVSN